ncbi:MAG: gliding motility-associated C-terminal domain-containing protein [Winogradskyella sp.]|uniref:T9SS type B sorting domain-containing protein n=1 Tax=Winogradskyella sp. TaxID=1883156 RepID=UPI00385BF381
MKKITLFLIMLGSFLAASAQYNFAPIAGPTTVAQGTPVTINLNDVANVAGVPASTSGSYDSFSITVDWAAVAGGPFSNESDLTLTTTAGSVLIDPPTAGAAGSGTATTLTFAGDFTAIYNPTVDGYIDLILNQSWAGSSADWSNIVVTLFESPTCVAPTAMATTSLTTTAVDLIWTAGDAETAWNVEYNGGADFVPGNGEEEASANVTGTPTTAFSGLTPSTNYFVYYQADCGGADGTSEWVGPFTFFTSYCESIPTSNDGQGIAQVQLGSETFTSGGDLTFEDFTSPTVDLAAAITSNLEITFTTGFTYGTNVWIDFNNDLVFDSTTELVYQGESTNANPTTLDASFPMPDVPLGIYNMRIGTADSGQTTPNPCYSGTWGVTMDLTINITAAPDCIPPSSLAATTITEDSAELTWNGGGTGVSWDLEWGPTGFTPGTGTLVTGLTAQTYPLPGLTAGTGYDFYVVSNCAGAVTSSVSGPSTFITAIPGETCANAFPMTVEVDCDTATPITFDFANGADIDANNENPSCDGFGNFGYWVSFTAPAIGSVIFNFDGAADNIGIEVFDACGGTAVSDCANNNLDAGDNSGVIGGLTPGDTYFAVIWRDAQSGTAEICIEEGPSCPFPIDLDADNITENSADLIWTENGVATTWNIEWGPTGFAPGTGTTISAVATNPFNLMGLDQNTVYDFYVQAICGVDTSDFEGPFTFTTTPQSNFTLDCVNDGPITQDYCYENGGANNPLIFTFTSADGVTPLNLTFNSGFVENGWDELVVLDSDGTPFPGFAAADDNYGNGGNIGGLTFQSVGPTISFFINSDGSISCGSGSAALLAGINYTVSCATCINPQASFAVIDDCANGDQFLIDVNVTSLGDASSLTISNSNNGDTVPVTVTGVYQIGPFPFLEDIIVTINNDQDTNCVINSQPIQLLACPPDNDNCDGAITAVVNETSTCDLLTTGTILAATPSGVPSGTCTGNPDDDVWFEFTALNEVQIISLLNITGGVFDLSHGLYEGSCGSLTELYCSNNESSVTTELVIGNTYFIRVFSGGSDAETSTFDLCIRPAPSNIICDNAENFCSVGGALTTPNIIGIPNPNPVACLGTAPNPTWNIIQVGESGPIEIQIEQTDDAGNGLDVDFVIWGPFDSVTQACTDILLEDCPSCPFSNNPDNGFYPFGNIVDCSYSAAAIENLSIDNALAGEIYMLLVTNFNGGAGSITIEQTNAGSGTNGTIEAEISAEITSLEVPIDGGNDPTEIDIVDVCGFDTVTIETDSPFADEYVWFEDGFEIPGQTSSALTVPLGGFGLGATNYQVQATDNQCGDDAFSQIVIVNMYADAGSVAPQNITLCDDVSANGEEDFDLTALSASLGLDAFTISYYTNTSDANQAIGAVSSPYTSSGETLIMRIEDTAAANNNFLGCRQLSQVELVVNAIPVAGQATDLEICSTTTFAAFNLTDNDAAVLDGSDAALFTVTYHLSAEDAETGDNPLVSPYTNISNPQTIYVRLEDNATSCFGTTTFTINSVGPSQTATSENLLACDDNDGVIDSFADFNLAAHTAIVLGAQSATDFNVTYHESQADADNGVGALADIISSSGETIFIRVENATLPDCYVTTAFDLILNAVPLAEFDEQFTYEVCPNATVPVSIGLNPQNFADTEVSVNWSLNGSSVGGNGLTLETVLLPGDYTATVIFNATNCTNTFTIEVVELESCIFPEGISPNNDMMNDTFDLSSFNVTKLQIFNRNGTLVYSKNGYTDEWFGQTNDGEELPVGTYFYTVVYEGGAKSKSAWVYINR